LNTPIARGRPRRIDDGKFANPPVVQALYAFVTSLFVLGWYCSHALLGGCTQARTEFSYFTVLTYWGLAFYFLVAAVHTLSYALTGAPLLDRFPRLLQALHSFFYTTIVVYPVIVTIVYWARLYSGTWFPDEFSAWSNLSRHALNSLLALFEIFMTRTAPPPPVHMLWLIVVLALYLGLAYLTRATKGFYVYSFLDPAESGKGFVVAYVFGIAVGCLIVFGVVWGLIRLRQWVTENKLHMNGKFARQRAWRSEAPDHDLEMRGK